MTFTGSAANGFVAAAMASQVTTQEEATAKLAGTVGPMRAALARALRERGFAVDAAPVSEG